jgi:Ca2+-binding EF-hand superfamily protein
VMIPQPLRKKRYLAAGVAATVGFGLLAALPSAAANPDLHIAFQRLDGNSDGKLELAEFTSTPFPDMAYFREARMNGALGMPRDIVWVWPGVRQSAVEPNAVAPSEDGRDEDGEDFRRFDADNDRVVSYKEFQVALSGMMFAFFEAMDRDKDGNISRGELDGSVEISARSVLARSGPLMKGGEVLDSFAAYDRNGDGVVTFEEYVPQP